MNLSISNIEQSLSSLKSNKTASDNMFLGKQKEDLQKATQDFEAMFVKQMLDSMRKTVPEGTLLEKNAGQDIFEDMLYDQYAKSITKTSNLGIAKSMYEEMSAKAGLDI